MNVKNVTREGVLVLLSSEELLMMSNALNEVCNGLDMPEFSTRMGVQKEEALAFLETLGSAFDKVPHAGD